MPESGVRATAMQEFSVDTAFGRISGLRHHRHGGDPRNAPVPRVLALHGWLDNAASFVPLQPYLPALEIVAPDLPGNGASAHLPPAADYTVVGSARAAFAIADALGWDRFSLLGHSLGGAIASVMAAAMPQRIERLLVIEALGALAEPEDHSAARLRDAFTARAAERKPLRVFADVATAVRARMQVNGLTEPVARLLVERGIAPVSSDDADRAGGYVWRSDQRLTQPTAVRLSEGQVRDMVRAIECPTRVIYAEPAQPYFPEVLRRERFECLRNGDLVVMPGSHHLHMEDPAGVAAAIGDFFTAAEPARPA